METMTTVVIVVAIIAAVFGLRWVVGVSLGRYAESHAWLGVTAAFVMVIWSVLDATGVYHESPFRMVRTYIGGAMGAMLLIALGVLASKKPR